MKDEQDWTLYDLWRLASRKGYSLRLEGDYIRLVPLTTQGDAGLPRTFRWTNDGIKAARAWLDPPICRTRAKFKADWLADQPNTARS